MRYITPLCILYLAAIYNTLVVENFQIKFKMFNERIQILGDLFFIEMLFSIIN